MTQPIAIIAAMAQEVALLQSVMTHTITHHHAGTAIHQGQLDNQPIILMQCGIGKVNAAIGTTLLIDHFHAQAIINTGSAGGLTATLNTGDIVIADTLIHHDVDVTTFGYALGQMAQMPATYHCDPQWIEAAKTAAQTFPNANIQTGLIISGDQFIAGGERLQHIRSTFPKALAVEMEAAAIAQTCYQFNTPYIIIRAISDNADGDASISFETFLEQAATHSAEMVRALIKHATDR